MRNVLLVALLALAGCSGLGARAEDPTTRCYEIQDQYRIAGIVAAAALAVGGSGALAAAAPAEPTPRLVFGISAAAVAAIAASSVWVRDDLVAGFQLECTETSTVAP